MKSLRLTQNAFQKKTTPKQAVEIPAWMGDLNGVVKADDYSNVYVTLYNGQTLTAKNHKLPNIPRLPVLIGQDATNPNVFVVLRMQNAYDNPPYLDIPDHAEKNHSEYGIDPVRVTNGQIYGGLAYPISGTLTVQFYGLVYYLNGWHVLDNQIVDLTAQVPVSAGAKMVMIEVDAYGVISFRSGATKDTRELLTYEDIPLASSTKSPLFAVSLYYLQTKLQKTRAYSDIYDLRFAGVSTGGIASSILWADILDKPAIFPPDTSYTDPLYPRKWLKYTPPAVTDDNTAGYSVSDIWVDQSGRVAYVCIGNATGAALWTAVLSSGGDATFAVDGALVALNNVPNAYICVRDVKIVAWYVYCKTTGSASSTIVDVNKNGTTVFTTQANRPTLLFSDPNNWAVSGTPDVTAFAVGDVITVDIDQVATGAKDLIVAGGMSGSGSAGNFNLVVEESDGSPSVANVGKIKLDAGLSLTNNGSGIVTITPAATLQPALILLEQHTASASVSLDFTSCISSTYDEYMIEILNLVPGTDNVALWWRVSTDGGATYLTTNVYAGSFFRWSTGGTAVSGQNPSAPIAQVVITGGQTMDFAATAGVVGTLRLFQPQSTTAPKRLNGAVSYLNNVSYMESCNMSAQYVTAGTSMNAFRFLFSSGNIASGTIRVYGVSK